MVFCRQWDEECGASLIARMRFYFKCSPQLLESVSYAHESEMPLLRSGAMGGVETFAVVADREGETVAVNASGDLDGRGLPVVDCVGDEFSDD